MGAGPSPARLEVRLGPLVAGPFSRPLRLPHAIPQSPSPGQQGRAAAELLLAARRDPPRASLPRSGLEATPRRTRLAVGVGRWDEGPMCSAHFFG